MSKIQKNILNVLTISLLNISFWMCNIYPKHILEFESITSILSVLINLLFFVVFDYILIIVFSDNKTVFSEGIFNKKFAKKLLWLIAVQLVFDEIIISLNAVDLQWRYIVTDILTALQWLVNYFIITYRDRNIFKNKKLFTIMAFVVTGITVLSMISNTVLLTEYSEAVLKYETGANILSAIRTNTEFIYSIKLLALDSLLGTFLIVLQSFVLSDNEKQKQKNSKTAVQLLILFAVFSVLTVAKIHILPDRSIAAFNKHNSESSPNEESEKFNVKNSYLRIYRFSSEEKIICYGDYTACLSKGASELLRTEPDVSGLMYDYRSENGLLFEDIDFFAEFDIDSAKAFIYNSQAICFYENGNPQAVSLDELEEIPQNDIITAVCKKSLEDGNIFIFEYCYGYLLKYDKGFIDEYIERYSKGDYTSVEAEWMNKNFYKSEYVTNLAKSILAKAL